VWGVWGFVRWWVGWGWVGGGWTCRVDGCLSVGGGWGFGGVVWYGVDCGTRRAMFGFRKRVLLCPAKLPSHAVSCGLSPCEKVCITRLVGYLADWLERQEPTWAQTAWTYALLARYRHHIIMNIAPFDGARVCLAITSCHCRRLLCLIPRMAHPPPPPLI
jgi:hypothetical protein